MIDDERCDERVASDSHGDAFPRLGTAHDLDVARRAPSFIDAQLHAWLVDIAAHVARIEQEGSELQPAECELCERAYYLARIVRLGKDEP